MKTNYSRIPAILSAIVAAIVCYSIFLDAKSYLTPAEAQPLTSEQKEKQESVFDVLYPDRNEILSPLPYSLKTDPLSIYAGSAILIDTATGSVLYEKNADEKIPPASMTKLVEMYVVLDAVEKGEVSLDDEVPLPPQSWAVNLPSDASIMFLAQGKHVTLRELLLGLAIASGNDASIAVAYYVGGSMEAFVKRMNDVIFSLGLKNTHFVESSGYSEQNKTTARDFAAFAREYINRFPETITDYHSQRVLKYPLKNNLPDSQKEQGDSQAVVQYNTNKLLGTLEGCDGLKTGFIYESGYNITLTAQRNGTRLLSVTMKGPGKGSAQGNRYRSADGTTLMEYGFSNFADYHPDKKHVFDINVIGSKEKTIQIIPYKDESFTVPHIKGATAKDAAKSVKAKAYIPRYLYGNIKCGDIIGTITYSIDDTVLQTLPLVADRDCDKKTDISLLHDFIIYNLLELLTN